MTEDQDNAGDVVAATVRVALTAAGQLAEQAARRREAQLREAERDSAARVATLQSQLAAERELALRSVQDVLRRGSTVTVEEVALAWQQVRSWENPVLAAERDRLEDLVRDRFGLDAHTISRGGSEGMRVSQSEQVAYRDMPTATAVIARDTGRHVDDAHRTEAAGDRMAGLTARLEGAGIDAGAARARALAAESHPTQPGLAARRPVASRGLTPAGTVRRPVTEVQAPGR